MGENRGKPCRVCKNMCACPVRCLGRTTGVIHRTGAKKPPPPAEDDVAPAAAEHGHTQKERRWDEIVWRNVILLTFIHMCAVYAITQILRAKVLTIVWAFLTGCMCALGITAGAHRLWAHKSYKAKLPFRILLAILNCMAAEGDIIEWSRDHRVHHKFTETDADPHNAKRGFFFSHMGWLFVRKHPDVKEKGKQVDLSDLYADPVVRFQQKVYKPAAFICSLIIPMYVPHIFWGESLLYGFLAVMVRYCLALHFTWLVNSWAHLYGDRPYDKRINPADSKLVAFFSNGEGFHNYHHVFPQDYAAGEFGWYYNPTCMFIDIGAYFGQVYDRKTISKDMILRTKEKYGDGSN